MPKHSAEIIMDAHSNPVKKGAAVNSIVQSPIDTMVIRVVEFSSGGYKIRKTFALESTYPKEMFEF